MELVSGRTLRDLLSEGSMPMRRLLGVASQIADGLARAHEADIVHRDLKPENVMLTRDGHVKVLDFGLAKLVPRSRSDSSQLQTAIEPTRPGVVLGTVGYMSPEQASGKALDFRSDQFSFGSVLYEIVTGRRAFVRATAVDTLSAILHDEPETASVLRPETPTGLRWLLERCLAKEPDERYASTRDLARDLATLRDRLAETGSSAPAAVRRGSRRMLPRLALLVSAGAALVLGGLLLGRSLERKPPPSYRQLTFRQGTIRSARFSPDGQTVVYAAAWAGQPIEVFTVRPGAPESRPLGLTGANVRAVWPSGELAVLIRTAYMGLFPGTGTLARCPSKAARPLAKSSRTSPGRTGPRMARQWRSCDAPGDASAWSTPQEKSSTRPRAG